MRPNHVLRCALWAACATLFVAPLDAEILRVNSVTALERAMSVAARLRLRKPSEPVTIELAAGTYNLAQPVFIDERLSGTASAPFEIRPARNSTVVISGGRDLTPLRWEKSDGGIWRARVTGPGFQWLWLDGRRLVRARYPNYDPKTLPLAGYSAAATSPQRVRRWADPSGGVIQAIHKNEWGGVHVPILGKNADGTLRLGPETGNNRDGGPSDKERFVENIREELDAPDEWFFDQRAGWLYYMPRDDVRPPARGFIASRLETVFRIEGRKAAVHDVRIHGFEVRHTEPTFLKTVEPLLRSDWKFYRGGAVLIENADRIEIADSDFSELGGNAIVVSGHARAITVRDNEISRIGASAISFVGRPDAVRSPLFEYHQSLPLGAIDHRPGPKNNDYPADSTAEDNLIHDIGEIEKQSAGVEIATAKGIRVIHNSIYRVPRAGINVGDGAWGGHLIEGNDVFDTVLETGDHGAFNSWGRDRYWNPDRDEMDRRVAADRSLVRLDTIEPIIIRGNRFRCDHGWDIDLDDGSSNYIIENNLLLAGGLKFREGFDRAARNNVIVNNTFHPHVWFKDSGDVFEHNIVMTGYQPILMKSWGRSVDWNLFTTSEGVVRARANGTDTHSVAANPEFVDPAVGDYRVRRGSAAETIGFKNFPMNEFGVRTARLRAKAATPAFPAPILRPSEGSPAAPREYVGMKIKTVETLGEQSAAGLSKKEGVLVLSVEPGSLAAKAGLQAGDVILSIIDDDYGQSDATATASDFVAASQGRRWRGEVDIEISRNQSRQKLHLPLR